MDEIAYLKRQDEGLKDYESLCNRCGKCCGSGTSEPCNKLARNESGKYYCISYDDRLGSQFTVSGLPFTCVPIREVIEKGLPYEGCGYGR